MANPTTNFGWVMPTSTDLVTDLPADFAVFGQAVDTSMADLKGGTTGQVLAKASNTDMDFVWSADATGIPASAFTAKGNILVGTGVSTYSAQTVGTNGQVLTADSSEADGVKWATPSSGSRTLLASGTLSSSSVLLSSISGDYKDLLVVITNYLPATDATYMSIRFNDDSTANRHQNLDPISAGTAFGGTKFDFQVYSSDNATTQSFSQIYFYDYANTTTWKLAFSQGIFNNASTPANVSSSCWYGAYNQTTAVTSLRILNSSGNFTSGNYYLYGVK